MLWQVWQNSLVDTVLALHKSTCIKSLALHKVPIAFQKYEDSGISTSTGVDQNKNQTKTFVEDGDIIQ